MGMDGSSGLRIVIVIVGGVAGGASAAAKARRTNENADIAIYEKGAYVSFANCGLPYYVGGTIEDRNELLLQTPERFWKRFRVRVHVLHEVLSIDRKAQSVTVKNLKTGVQFAQSYDRLVLAPGAGAIVPLLSGADHKNVFTVKTVPDSDAIKRYLSDCKPKDALIVGGGFIGLETAEALKKRGLSLTIIESASHLLPNFDPEVAHLISTHLEEQGVRLVLDDGIATFHGDNQGTAVKAELQSGRLLSMDLAILSIGVRPELTLAKDAGLEIGNAGGIVVNDQQQTSDPNIYAAGDAVETIHLVTGKRTRIPLAGPANKQGRVAGANAAGGDMLFPGALGTAIVETMGITAAKTGLSFEEAVAEGFKPFVSITHSPDHADYYPGAQLLHIKIVAEQGSGRLLGAQIVGEHGVDKRIDVLATALTAKMRVQDLENLDLAYAPQFGSAKDPVVIAGYVAANTVRGEVNTITCEKLKQLLANGESIQLLDVRTSREYNNQHFPCALLIPIDEFRDHLWQLDPLQKTVVYCAVGLRAYLAARILQQHGFKNVSNLTGGFLTCPDE